MPSPFPGMDPFLEGPDAWLDFHSRFVNAWCEAIADRLPQEYEANLGERICLVETDPDTNGIYLSVTRFHDSSCVAFPRGHFCGVRSTTRWQTLEIPRPARSAASSDVET